MRRTIRALALAAACCVAHGARAQAPTPERYEQLFDEGRALRAKGDCRGALGPFEASHMLHPGVGTLFNIAECEEQLGRIAAALRHLEEAVVLAEQKSSRWLPDVKAARDRLAQRVSGLVIKLAPNAPRETVVTIDGQPFPRASFGVAVPADPGKHKVTATAPGWAVRAYEVELVSGKDRVLTVAPGVAEAAGTAPPGSALPGPAVAPAPEPVVRAPPAPKAPPDRTAAYVAGSFGLAGIAVAAITGGMLLSKRSTIDKHCTPDKACDSAEGTNAADSARRLVPINTAAWIVGGLGLGAGTILWFTAAPASGEAPSVGFVGVRGAL
jgi:hypothetical protein